MKRQVSYKMSKSAFGWELIKWLLLLLTAFLGATVLTSLIPQRAWLGVIIVSAVVLFAFLVYGSKHFVPVKYFYAGLVLLLAFQVWPTIYTVSIAFTNYGDGHLLSKEESIDLIEKDSFQEIPDGSRYDLTYLRAKDGLSSKIVALLKDQDGNYVLGSSEGLSSVNSVDVVQEDGRDTIAGYSPLNAKQISGNEALKTFSIPKENSVIRPLGLNSAVEGVLSMRYDSRTDTIVDQSNGVTYSAREGNWVGSNGEILPQGWREYVGWNNFYQVISDPVIRSGFISIFIWNCAFALVSVLSTFILGLICALIFNSRHLHGKGVGRAILILPYAIPGFVSALVWKSMFNQEFGLINTLTGLSIDWLGGSLSAKGAVLLTNLWLGFPYMFLVCLGALQSIPNELNEAATIDGASLTKRTVSITLPLLLTAVGPLLVASFAFNFNNFGLIYLLTGGGPFTGNNITVGDTDLLITYAFRLAFGGTGDNYGLASAVSIFIFVLVAAMGAIGFGRSKAWEDMR